MKSFADYYRENLTTSILEPIIIDGIGDVEARVSNDNNSMNHLHGINIDEHDGKVSFVTVHDKPHEAAVVGRDDHGPQIALMVTTQQQQPKKMFFTVVDKTNDPEKCVLGIDHIKPIDVEQN
jgi:hypothetical protein